MTPSRRDATGDIEVSNLLAYCALPSCRKELRRSIGRGRPLRHCNDICRRQAERELRQKRATLQNYLEVAEQVRIDIAAFGRDLDDSVSDSSDMSSVASAAAVAVSRAAAVLDYTAALDDRMRAELLQLHAGVAPLLEMLGQSSSEARLRLNA